MEYSRVGKRGTVVIPFELRRRHRIDEGTAIIIEDHPDGVLLRAAPVAPSPLERQKFFERLNTAVSVTQLDAEAWAEELADRAALDGTLADNLDDDGYAETGDTFPNGRTA